MDDLLHRVERLERQNRMLKLAAPLLVLVVVGIGAAGRNAESQSLTVQKITLVDAAGNVGAILSADPTGTVLTFYGNRTKRLRIGSLSGEPRLDVWDEAAQQWRNKVGGPMVVPVR